MHRLLYASEKSALSADIPDLRDRGDTRLTYRHAYQGLNERDVRCLVESEGERVRERERDKEVQCEVH